MDHYSHSSSRADRKTIEKNRRSQMKDLCSKLSSLVPHQPTTELVSLSDQLEGATDYIKKLQLKLEKLKQKKNFLMGNSQNPDIKGLQIPAIDVHASGSDLDVILTTGPDCQFMFTETIRILHEEGAQVVSAGFSVVDQTVFHSIHSKIGDCAVEDEASRISERLRKFACDFN
ncbi:hypothetical protein CDL12_07985 [Handroanthus impetiginosus]|uniref:BHLH domain-containing protein n=1 Tax=Handroanthus impetiginosus TaxID=429701 RepID=A0A2G9HP77_9LAMI|nr:hypothetical protein CDL12_07985 [Handroanthus impetiginosus]